MALSEPFIRLTLADEAASARLGEDLAPALRAGDCLLLSGDLGMGKTTLARALIRAFLDDDETEVPSPTFTLVNLYEEGRSPLAHFDLYRLSDPQELTEIGFFDALKDGIILVEWPERAAGEMPTEALKIDFSPSGTGRSLAFTGSPRWAERIGRTLEIREFLDQNGWKTAKRRFLQGDASPRAYETISDNHGKKAILMNAPATTDGSIVRDGKRYSELAHLAEDVRPFVAIGEALRARGLPAPEIYAQAMDKGFLLLQDFGRGSVIEADRPVAERYEVALDLLAAIHSLDWPETVPLPGGNSYTLPVFDKDVVDIELSLLAEWYAPHVAGAAFQASAIKQYQAIWNDLFDRLSRGEKSWMLRDYHSPNLIWRPQEAGLARIGIIDYQDALIGPSAYDVASLCQDARHTVPPALEAALKDRYAAARAAQEKPFDRVAFEADYAIIAAERGTRLLGLWPRLKMRDGKPHYMKHMPRTKEYLRRSLMHPILRDLRRWYDQNLKL